MEHVIGSKDNERLFHKAECRNGKLKRKGQAKLIGYIKWEGTREVNNEQTTVPYGPSQLLQKHMVMMMIILQSIQKLRKISRLVYRGTVYPLKHD